MTGADAEIARTVRRELSKRPIDTSLVDVSVKAGRVTLAGRVAPLRDQPDVNVRSEMELVEKLAMRDRLVKEFFNQVHYQLQHEDKEDETDTRGRMRR